MGYAASQAITVDHTKCGSADSSNFPLLFKSTVAGLKTVANGGSVQSGTGLDIAFYSDALLTTLLPFEVESWSASTGAIVAWVKVPTLSVSSDTVIYLAYGDASIVSSQQNVTGTWESSFHGVWHLGTGGGELHHLAARRRDGEQQRAHERVRGRGEWHGPRQRCLRHLERDQGPRGDG